MALIYAIIESNVSCFMNRPCVFQQLDAYSKITTTGILSGMWLMALFTMTTMRSEIPCVNLEGFVNQELVPSRLKEPLVLLGIQIQ